MKEFIELMMGDTVDMDGVEILAEGDYTDANGKGVKVTSEDLASLIMTR